MKKYKTFIIIGVVGLVLGLIFSNSIKLISIESEISQVKKKIDEINISDTSKKTDDTSTQTGDVYKPTEFELIGTIKKEEIPEDLQLGDYWYWFYGDEPILLKSNASGYPVYVEKIQVYPPKHDMFNIDDYLDKKVQIYGTQGWGYSESTIIQLEAIYDL